MTKVMHRNKRLRNISYRTPGNDTRKRYVRKVTTIVKCGNCKTALHGATSLKSASKTQKTPTRVYAGELCHTCTEQILKIKTRINEKTLAIESVEPRYRKYI
ncbi:MAG: hypothetical protein J4432_04820 [DPANN group archaeon]|nr:hypothetical protein [DPANN group archaeon]